MSTPARVLAFVAVLVAAFAGAWGVGNAVDPVGREPVSHGHADDADATDEGEHGDAGSHATDGDHAAIPAGLQATQDGYSLQLVTDRLRPGRREVAFMVHGPDGKPVTAYDVQHEKQLHLIAVRRDFTGFQHVHPQLDSDGTWRIPLELTPGQWRVFADFKPTDGPALVLGTDLAVSGSYQPETPWATTRTAHVDGYTVVLEGDFRAGPSTLVLRILRDGAVVTDLEPYLGAKGHLVALRRGDLGYLHVHPDGLDFHAEVPSAGTYELWLDFKHDGVVRTAHFTLSTEGTEGTEGAADEHDHGHEEPDEHAD
jgi:hypothetical protein